MRRRQLSQMALLMTVAASLLASCAYINGMGASTARPRATLPAGPPATSYAKKHKSSAEGLPVDTSLAAVSRSNPGKEAQAALDLCHVTDLYGMDSVTRMAQIPSAIEAPTYVRLTGREPQIQTKDFAWLLEFEGGTPEPYVHSTWFDMVCIVIDGSPMEYATGDRVASDGTVTKPPDVASAPTLALPTLAP